MKFKTKKRKQTEISFVTRKSIPRRKTMTFLERYRNKKITKPIKVRFTADFKRRELFEDIKEQYPTIELKGEPIESFERVSKIKEVILLGEDGEIRRIVLI